MTTPAMVSALGLTPSRVSSRMRGASTLMNARWQLSGISLCVELTIGSYTGGRTGRGAGGFHRLSTGWGKIA